MTTPFMCNSQKNAKVKTGINRSKRNDCVISQMKMGVEITTTKRVPRAPDAIPANQQPIKRQAMAINLSWFFECFQLQKQNTVMPNTAVEKGIGLPENISNLPKKSSVTPNLSAKLFVKIK